MALLFATDQRRIGLGPGGVLLGDLPQNGRGRDETQRLFLPRVLLGDVRRRTRQALPVLPIATPIAQTTTKLCGPGSLLAQQHQIQRQQHPIRRLGRTPPHRPPMGLVPVLFGTGQALAVPARHDAGPGRPLDAHLDRCLWGQQLSPQPTRGGPACQLHGHVLRGTGTDRAIAIAAQAVPRIRSGPGGIRIGGGSGMADH
mmetsp:Transcript_3188/g.8813  ORF Transcript_3188/g.8813 Transcript_3188/m.8813 type:complete len:200 (+) Transcript_3188:1086-1685(+)